MNRLIILMIIVLTMICCGFSAGLPNSIQRLEYLESTGNEWIDTGFSPTVDTCVEAKLIPLGCSGAWHALFGVWYGDEASLGLRYNGHSRDVNAIFCGYSPSCTFKDMSGKELTLSMRYGSITLNGETRNFNPNGRPNENENLYIFGNHTKGGATGLQAMKLYYLRIFDKQELVRDFIPVKSEDGKLGLWDKVGGRFYRNQGAGEFLGKELLVAASKSSVPTKEEITAAKKSMAALMSTDMAPDELVKLATEATRSGEKYHLYRQSFIGFAKKGDVVSAIDVLDQYIAAFANLPDEDVLSLLNSKAVGSVRKDPEIAKRIKVLNIRMSAAKQLTASKSALKKAPRNSEILCRVAEAEVTLGNWEGALASFEKADGKVAKISKDESVKINLFECANFWWEYEPTTKATLKEFYRAHAVDLYSEALEFGKLSVVEKAVAEKRIVAAEELSEIGEAPSLKDDKKTGFKIIANSNGLIHRWTFNDTLEDEYSKYGKAGLYGNATISNRCAHLFGGKCPEENNIFLHGRSIPNDGSQITIEMWATQNKVERFARILTFGRRKGSRVEITWGLGDDLSGQQVMVSHGYWKDGVHLAPFTLGEEFHIAFVFSYKADLKAKNNKIWYLTGYKQDAKTGRTIAKFQVELEEGFTLKDFPVDLFHLGWSYSNNDYSANASYNEVRIWKRALSEGELTDNAKRFYKAGETMKK